MRSSLLLWTGALGTALIGTAATSAEPAGPAYVLSIRMKDGARVVGMPTLTVLAGKAARIEIGNEPGDHYAMDVTVVPQGAGIVTVASTIEVASGGIHHSAKPTLQVMLGKPSAIEFGEDSATVKPFRVDFTVNPAS